MDIGVSFGRFGSTALDKIEWAVEAESLGFESVWVGESYGSDALTPLSFIASKTSRIKLGTSVMQVAARSPASTAMSACTLDRLSGGRVILGLGVSSPAVVQGWHGAPLYRPVPWLRDYVGIIRAVWARDGRLQYLGTVLSVPPEAAGQIRLNVRPLREDIPVYLAANGPATVKLAAQIADGWMPVFFAAEAMESAYNLSLAGRPVSRVRKAPLNVSPVMHVAAGEDVRRGIETLRAETARYLTQAKAHDSNMNVRLARAYGFGHAVEAVRGLLACSAPRADIVAAVPDDLVDATNLIGGAERIRRKLQRLSDCGVSRVIGIVRNREAMYAFAESAL
jgi:F420-dependent oxidoreductase-like protein